MASQSHRNIIATLSLCESCALSLRESNETGLAPGTLITDMAKNLEHAAQEARKLWPVALTNKEADKIAEAMRKADCRNPFIDSSLTECTIYYTSLALGLLEELFRHIHDSRKLEHLARVEREIWHLHKYFDSDLDRFSIYEHASRTVPIWFECLNE
ncbi:MAG: hypothetical protein P4L55_04335 [Syntrophobacteraceae bacterium]|nr:hypothetical protein [Syntrophobacteraceae bacterium]